MATARKVILKGRVTSLSRQVQPGSFGIVTLDEPHDGRKYAVINDQTKGRAALTTNGCLQDGLAVIIEEFTCGPEAFQAKRVRRL